MKSSRKPSQEPVGIVISTNHGVPTPPQTTVFSAYVWAPAPNSESETKVA